MSLSLPGNNLYYLPRDNLAPEKYEEIVNPLSAWPQIKSEYVFDDSLMPGFQLINMRRRDFHGYTNQLPPHGAREQEKLKSMLFCGEVVMLSGFSASPGWLFYIDDNGELICCDPLSFKFDRAQRVIQEYKRSVARRDYSNSGGKPRPTVVPARSAEINKPASLEVINSKAAGCLLAADGIYNGNIDGFRKTAEQLGGEAPVGYNQIMNDQTKGLIIAGASVAAGLTMGRINIGAGNQGSVETVRAAVGKSRLQVKNLGNVNDFLSSQSAHINRKLGVKIGQGRLPYEASKAGIEQAKATIKETLETATQISSIIPNTSVRGKYDLIHVYSSKTNSTVSFRILSDEKYEFDTLIPEKSSKF
ncbi:hypothetical protein IDH70_14040 [Mixta calida]|nr:hypothetical protein IDH70_14040 [Mixta calida]